MPAREKSPGKDSTPKAEASSVIEKAIASMRLHPKASSAADAIEGACGSRRFDVDAAVKGVKAPEAPAEEGL
jgi:hypothetical protein